MEILYKQVNTGENPLFAPLEALGIERFYMKKLSYKTDRTNTSRKGHYHTGFEVHIITKGYQTYEVEGKSITVKEGELLAIFPLANHISTAEDPDTKKYAITFSTTANCPLPEESSENFFLGTVSRELMENIEYIRKEKAFKKEFYNSVAQCRALECALILFRLMGLGETQAKREDNEGDERVFLAKQYIRDNVLRPVTLPEVASYCCISSKQLTRTFKQWENMTVTQYVRKQRCLHIEKLLADRSLTLREISEKMNFSSEYYFNTLFKKHSGMSPGAYRKMLHETTAN